MKIGDFGLAKDLNIDEKPIKLNLKENDNHKRRVEDMSVKLQENVGTPLYQSPEQIDNKFYNEKVDIYAIGVILYEMCSLFRTSMDRRESLEKLRFNQNINSYVKENFKIETCLILKMTSRDPSKRPSAEEILKSEEFTSLRNEFGVKESLKAV